MRKITSQARVERLNVNVSAKRSRRLTSICAMSNLAEVAIAVAVAAVEEKAIEAAVTASIAAEVVGVEMDTVDEAKTTTVAAAEEDEVVATGLKSTSPIRAHFPALGDHNFLKTTNDESFSDY